MDVVEDNIQMNLKKLEQASSAKYMVQCQALLKSVMKIICRKAREFIRQLNYYQLLHQVDVDASSVACHSALGS
jgi:hypothetical protein